MHRQMWGMVAGLVMSLGVLPAAAAGQDPVNRRASLFDLGIYAGGAWTSDWFEVNDESEGIGVAPLFGATATYWTSPTFGIRLHGAYMPSQLPEGDNEIPDNDWLVNNWLYDLNLVFRPWTSSPDAGPFAASTSLFGGIGAVTTNFPGPSDAQTSIAVNVGARASLFDLGPTSSVFGELGIRGYRAPGEDFPGVDRKFSFTVDVGLGVNFGFGEPR